MMVAEGGLLFQVNGQGLWLSLTSGRERGLGVVFLILGVFETAQCSKAPVASLP